MSIAPLALLIVLLTLLAGTAGPALDPEENALWALINDYRQAHGAHPVGLNDQLMAAAEWMSEDMASNDYYSHTDSLGRSARERMADFGYIVRKTTTGENLVAGVATAQAAFDLLKGSPKHDANMLSKYFCAVGIARAYDKESTYGWYWTVDFGGRGPAWFPPTPAPTPTPVPTATPPPVPAPTPAPVPDEFPSTGTEPRK